MSLEEQIATELTQNPGQKAAALARRLGVDKKEVNSLLYGKLGGQFTQDNQYCWWPVQGSSGRPVHEAKVEGYKDTPLSRLSRYYLSCLGQDDIGEVSAWARNNFDDYDYVQLADLPLGNIQQVIQQQEPAALLNKIHRDRTPKVLYLAYPVSINRFTAKSGNVIHRLEPVFVLPIQFDQGNNRGEASLSSDFPIMNTAVLKRFTNADRDGLMSELLALEDELGFGDGMDVPELDEIVHRLQAIRPEWPWQEDCDASSIPLVPHLGQLDEPGIYNRAVLMIAERKPYTQGLENELRDLAKLSENEYSHTALGRLVHGKVEPDKADEIDTLIEVLPMNLEQRLAIERSLTQPLTIITGPPGTGKSQVVTNLLVNAAWQGKKVLFASKNNKAVDVVEARVNNLGSRPILLRMGSNEYQVKLKDYLQGLLASSAGADEKLEYDESVSFHHKLEEKLAEVKAKQAAVIELRNKVDELEQSVEVLREQLGEVLFAKVKYFDLDSFKELKATFIAAIDNANKEKQGVLTRLTWGMQKSRRFTRLAEEATLVKDELASIDIELPTREPDELTFSFWNNLVEAIEKRAEQIECIRQYFSSLKALQQGKSLEELNEAIRNLQDKISDNSEKLWNSWLKVSPSRLNAEDRQLLSQYVAILQMVTDSGNRQVQGSVWRQYYQLTEKVSHFLPCWAVTSLSARGKLPFTPANYDLVIFDEASQCDIASALPLLYRAKSVVVIGDPMQLSHISGIHKHQDQQLLERFDLTETYLQWAYSWNSLFDMASSYASGENIVNLRDHHRSHADIINFSNNFFYEGRLRVATQYDRLVKPSKTTPGVRWLDVKGETKRPPNGSAINPQEAQSVVAELKRLVLDQGYRGTIGVVSPFRAQANLIKELCFKDEQLQKQLDNLEFLSDTVHRFQGDERDLIVFSPVISQGVQSGTAGFLRRNGNLFNVAITRARAMLLVVGDLSVSKTSDVEYLAEFARYVEQLEIDKREQDSVLNQDFGPEYPSSVDRSKVSDWEVILYKALYQHGIRTIPQYPVEQYLLDLAVVISDKRLDIEVDGERYHRMWTGELCRRDQIRNQRMHELGWEVIRFWVYEVRDDMDGCIARIKQWIDSNK